MRKHAIGRSSLIPVIAGTLALGISPSQAQQQYGNVVSNQRAARHVLENSALKVQRIPFTPPLSFEANRGQMQGNVLFRACDNSYTLFLTTREAVLVLPRMDSPASSHNKRPDRNKSVGPGRATILHMHLIGAEPDAHVLGVEPLPGKINYYPTCDPRQWRVNVPTYAKVCYRNVYPGVDLTYYGRGHQLEYDFTVAPGKNPKIIRVEMKGARSLYVDKAGNLIARTAGGAICWHRPILYQQINGLRKPVAGGYRLYRGQRVGFYVARYDRTRPLVIDPALVYSTYLGGSSSDFGRGIAVDQSGNAYVVGSTLSTNFPTQNAYQNMGTMGVHTAFLAKLAPNGALLYSTYFGSGTDGWSVAVDGSGNAYLAGSTGSTILPLKNAYQTQLDLGLSQQDDAFVAKFDANGALVYSTYLGGSGEENTLSIAIAVDPAGYACVTGATNSTDFPTQNAIQATRSGIAPYDYDAFVTRFDPNGGVVYSTYLGGYQSDYGKGVAVDASGNAYVIGFTDSPDLPTTSNAFQPHQGGSPVYVSADSGVSWTRAGNGLNDTQVRALAVDPKNTSTLYAGAYDGIYKTTDGGADWQAINTGIPTNTFPNFYSLAIDPQNTSTLYASGAVSSLFKTTDGGAHWATINTGLPANFSFALLAIDPTHPSTLYAGIPFQGVYQTTDGGGHWNPANTNLPANPNITALAVAPSNSSVVYVGIYGAGIYRSSNSGSSWFPGTLGLPSNSPVLSLAVDPTNANILYTGVYTGGLDTSIYKSVNGGSSFVATNITALSDYEDELAVDPMHPSTIYAGGIGIAQSTDGGQTWYYLSHLQPYTFAFDPTHSSTVYIGKDIGRNAFIAKFSPQGALSYLTYLGGSDGAAGSRIAVDPAGNFYATGSAGGTSGYDFPLKNPYQQNPYHNAPIFLTKFGPTGQLVYSTYFGGADIDDTDAASGVATDAAGNAYLAGTTTAFDFPLKDAFQKFLNGPSDGFVAKFDPTGQLFYSTYLGGSSADTVSRIATDPFGNAYVTGYTQSSDFPTVNAYQLHNHGGYDGFVAKIGEFNLLPIQPILGPHSPPAPLHSPARPR